MISDCIMIAIFITYTWYLWDDESNLEKKKKKKKKELNWVICLIDWSHRKAGPANN